MKLYVDSFWSVCAFDRGDEDYKYLKDCDCNNLDEIESDDVFEYLIELESELLDVSGTFEEALDYAKSIGVGAVIRIGTLYGGRLV